MIDPGWVDIFDFVPSAGLLMAIKRPLFLPQSSTFRATKGMYCFVVVGNVTEVMFIAKDPRVFRDVFVHYVEEGPGRMETEFYHT